MARGSIAKEEITTKILSAFEGAFVHDKIIRVPIQENGEIVEIKITLTAAKDVVGGNTEFENQEEKTIHPSIPNAEEIAKVEGLLERMGVIKN